MNMIIRFFLTLKACLSGLVILSLLMFTPASLADNLTASVDRNIIGLEETFILTLKYDEQINATPDYSLLRKDFDILNTQSGSYMTMINGRTESYTQWIISLAPRKIGKALIPSFNINGAISDAIEITVEGKTKTAQDTVKVDIQVDKSQGYVQEQLLVTLRLTTYVNISGANVEPLQIKDALVVQVDEKKYRNMDNGRESITYETTYAVYPQQSGEMVIPSVLYQVEVASNMRDYMDFFATNRGNLMRLRTDEQRIHIKPTPNDVRAQPWLPAKDIRIEEHWSSSPDTVKIGEPITRTLTIRAEGLSAGQLPPLPNPTINGLNSYQDQAQNDDQKSAQGVTGSRIETTAIVANQPGKFILPAITLHWWDTDEQMFKTATLAESTLNVSGIAIAQNVPASQENSGDISVPINTDINSLAQQQTPETKHPAWVYLLLTFSLIINFVLAILLWKSRRKLAEQQEVGDYFASQSAQEEKDVWNNLREAIATKDPIQIRKSIITWGKIFWADEQIESLEKVMKKFDSTELKKLFNDVDAAIYSNNQTPIAFAELLEKLTILRKAPKKNDEKLLETLYPS